jgi:hypothetical protein
MALKGKERDSGRNIKGVQHYLPAGYMAGGPSMIWWALAIVSLGSIYNNDDLVDGLAS